jgi:poly-beta-1,6-N-acetyl-D-glucosamine synthase
MVLHIVLGGLLGGYGVLLWWYRRAWRQLAPYLPSEDQLPRTSITVIIPARNEEATILTCLQCVVAQQYPAHLLQVLVMDDDSTDNTASVVAAFSKKYPFIQCVPVQSDAATMAHKKRAIEQGIAMAHGELMVCTDADCTMGPLWLKTLAQRFEQGDVQFIAAPVVYETEPALLSVFQTLDFMTLQGITGASVSKRFHTMCNGANIAYSKKAFRQVHGFAGIDALPTGDDMLLMYKIFKQYPSGVIWLKTTAATVRTQPSPTWSAFFQQRIRWASKAAYYDDKRIFYVLLLVYLVNVAVAGLALAGLVWPWCWYYFVLVLVTKTLLEIWFLYPVSRFFGKQQWLIWFPWLQLHHVGYTIIAGWLGRFGSYQWKGRQIQKPGELV